MKRDEVFRGRILRWAVWAMAQMLTLRGMIFVLAGFALAACSSPTGTGGGIQRPGAPIHIALLVPLGSADKNVATLGDDLVRAAQLAMNQPGGAVTMTVHATAGDPAQAVRAAQEAVTAGADVIVGPLFAAAANEVGNFVRGNNINVVSFSNTSAIAGGNVFVLGATFENSAARLVSFAAQRGVNRVVGAYENNATGRIGAQAIADAAQRNGVSYLGGASYELTPQGVVGAVPEIRGLIARGGGNGLVMTADASGALPMLSQLLLENQVNPSRVRFMGLTRWDRAEALGLAGLQGGWFTLPDMQAYAAYSTSFRSVYGKDPHPVSSVAYDAVMMLKAISATRGRSPVDMAQLTRAEGFKGASGAFRLLPNGRNQRTLSIAEVSNGSYTIISPAPQGFIGQPR